MKKKYPRVTQSILRKDGIYPVRVRIDGEKLWKVGEERFHTLREVANYYGVEFYG